MIRLLINSLIVCILLFTPHIAKSQYYIEKTFSKKEGLMHSDAKGVFQDDKGLIWVGNGKGFTRFYGDHIDQINGEEFVFQWAPLGSWKKVNEKYYWGVYEADNQGVRKHAENAPNELAYTVKDDTTLISLNFYPYRDKFGYLWRAYSNDESQSLIIERYRKGDTLNLSNYLESKGIFFTNEINRIEDIWLQNTCLYWPQQNFIEDNNEGLWFRSKDGGIHQFSFREKIISTLPLKKDNLAQVFHDKNNISWLTFYPSPSDPNPDIIAWNGEQMERFKSTGYSYLFMDSLDNIYCVNDSGLCIRRENRFSILFEDKNIVEVIVKNKYLYLLSGQYRTGFSIYRVKNDNTEKIYQTDLPVNNICVDREEVIWIATSKGGVVKLEPSRFQKQIGKKYNDFNEPSGVRTSVELPDGSRKYSLIDKNGDTYFMFENNLNKMEPNDSSVIHIVTIEDFSSVLIYGFSFNNDSTSIFVSSPFSLCKIDNFDDPKNVHVSRWDGQDGFDCSLFYWNSFIGDSILQLTNEFNDLDYFYFGEVQDSISPRCYFTSVNLSNEATTWMDYECNIIRQNGLLIPQDMILDYHNNHLTFNFQGVSQINGHKLSYEYRLTGLEKTFTESQNKSVSYQNLPSGDYLFEVRAINNRGLKSDIKTISFEIQVAWFKSWWAYLLYFVLFSLLVVGFLRSRTAKLKKRQKELETEVANATHEITQQKEIVEEAHKEITDSINYAERIQRSFLASEALLNENLGEHFIYFNPKEAVSGDFYWAGNLDNGNFAVSCADSTGHGVPGAIMSILNISSIEKAVENKATKPAEIFNQARKLIIDRLKKDGSLEGGKDGMDASLISFNPEKTLMQYVAAGNPIWVIRNGELIDIKAEKMPVGKHDHDHIPFEGGEFELQKGDIIYSLTDGYQDQFGGEKGKKYKVKPFKRLLLDIFELPMQEQHQKISDTFDEWKGDLEQVDDVCIIGVRI
ncbi:MAG: serine phosphatase RsbU (regulator of sigma subunit) [Arenicella sp.]|jgi:serine phosphatase RsbU (regulator of sigma subunit)